MVHTGVNRGPWTTFADCASRRPVRGRELPCSEFSSSAQPLDQRKDRLIEGPAVDGANLLASDAPLPIDDEGFRHAVYAPVDRHATVDIRPGSRVWIAHVVQ